jgi:hypothetical protein
MSLKTSKSIISVPLNPTVLDTPCSVFDVSEEVLDDIFDGIE